MKLNDLNFSKLFDHTLRWVNVNGFIIMCISTFKIFQSKYPQANVRCCEPLHKTKSKFNMKKRNLDSISSICIKLDRSYFWNAISFFIHVVMKFIWYLVLIEYCTVLVFKICIYKRWFSVLYLKNYCLSQARYFNDHFERIKMNKWE